MLRPFLCFGIAFGLVFHPGRAALPPADAVVVFNEIHYNPSSGDAGEWVELYNLMGVNMDVSGWTLSAGINFTFPDGTVIEGGHTLIVAKSPGSIPGALGPFTGQLSNSGETLRLLDNNGRLLDEFSYQDKGNWPVAADGSGATLAKLSPYLRSAESDSWTFSSLSGGTPGQDNFTLPSTTRVIHRADAWKYENSGEAFPLGWNETGFGDGSWSTDPGGFGFGNPGFYQYQAPVTNGIWTLQPWTGDADSGISTGKIYTHKVGLNRSGAYTAINGVTFDSPGSGVRAVDTSWSLTGASSTYVNNGNGQGANNLAAGSGSRQLCEEFFYSAAGESTLLLTGLTPGVPYAATFYATGFGAAAGRPVNLTTSDTGASSTFDENALGSGNGLRVIYHYVAPLNGRISIDFTQVIAASWHHYAFSNEEIQRMPSLVAGIAASGFSSQLTTGFNRLALYSANGAGLSPDGQTHGNSPNSTMWLSNGTYAAPNDPLPADITFDLGSIRQLSHFRVWNYNEVSFSNRGAKDVQILVSTNSAGPFTSVATNVFRQATGTATEMGQLFAVGWPDTRYVKLIITSNYGDTLQFAGLAEVRFYEKAPLATSHYVAYREAFTGVYPTGVSTNGTFLAAGSNDPHYTNVTSGNIPAVTQTGNPAWLGADSLSQWSGLTGNGQDTVTAQAYVWRTQFSLAASQATQGSFQFYTACDNRLNSITVNGNNQAINAIGFTGYLGPFPLTGLQSGVNTVDFNWANDAPNGPGGIRIRWEASAPPTNLVKTELVANPAATLFRRTFTWGGNPASVNRLLLQYAADDGAVFFLNGQEIHRTRVTGTPSASTLADTAVAFPTLSERFDLPGDALQVGTNVLAVSLHQSSAADADAIFFSTLDISETPPTPGIFSPVRFSEVSGLSFGVFFLEFSNTASAPRSLDGWQVRSSQGAVHTFTATDVVPAGGRLAFEQSALGFRPLDGDRLFLLASSSQVADAVVVKNNPQARDTAGTWLRPSVQTPGAANTFALNTDVVLHEIMYHHTPQYLPTGTVDRPEEWVELYNRGVSAVNLTGWKIQGGTSFSFAPGTQIAAGAYLVVASDPAALATTFNHLIIGTNLTGPLSGTLSNQGDEIILEDANGNPADEVRYFDSGRWDGRADGGGSSLELRSPFADNRLPESWAASDETTRSVWQSFSYTGSGAPPPGSNDPTTYNELVVGLLSDGECLLDDISVTEAEQGNRQCIQNGAFSADSSTWRFLGNHGLHGRTTVTPDPSNTTDSVLRLVAAGGEGHMHDHLETTLKSGGNYVTLNSANTYTLSFRARWISGSPRLHTRLYFNRLSRQHLLPLPDLSGTPGLPNGRAVVNAGPDLSALAHTPVVPEENKSVTVTVAADDANGLASVTLKWRLDGAALFTNTPMVFTNGFYSAQIPGQAASSLAQFYAEATDSIGAVSTLPAGGAQSRALVKWKELTEPYGPNQAVRILMLTADANVLHAGTNVMSNLHLPCTVIDRGSDVFYNAGVHLRSSERGRLNDNRVGFSVKVDPMTPFRGAHSGFNLDRSGYGRGTTGNGYGVSEIVSWRFLARAAGVPMIYDDMVHVYAPRAAHTGSALLLMADFNDAWLDSSYDNGADEPLFKYDFIYFPLATTGGPEGYKIPTSDGVLGVNFGSINTPDKEAYRWTFLLENGATDDAYGSIVTLNDTFRLAGAAFNAAITNTVDVDSWLRGYAGLTLAGIGDSYNNGNRHNIKFYARADGKLILVPWDMDFQSEPFNAALVRNGDITAMMNISETWRRRFYFHLRDIIDTGFNTAYMTPWVNHYATFNAAGGNFADITTYIGQRAAFVNGEISTAYPAAAFAITTNGGNDFSHPGPLTPLQGTGSIEIDHLRLQPGGVELAITWTAANVWQVAVPVGPGPNPLTLEAINGRGQILTNDVVTITGTGPTVPAVAGNLVISELHYHPADPSAFEQTAGYADSDDFEFIEVRNIFTNTISLASCRFTAGIDHTLPNIALIAGARLVIPRRAAAFTLRHPGVPVAAEYYLPTGNTLSNSGEELALVDALGTDIVRFSYGDGGTWPDAPDGGGPSLVLIAPGAAGSGSSPWDWRASVTVNGNPGGSDAAIPPANPSGDDDFDGIPNWVEYATGSGAARMEITANPATGFIELSFERNPLASVDWSLEFSAVLPSFANAEATLSLENRVSLPGGLEKLILRGPAVTAGMRKYYRVKLTLGGM